jgi:hypothetical protein
MGEKIPQTLFCFDFEFCNINSVFRTDVDTPELRFGSPQSFSLRSRGRIFGLEYSLRSRGRIDEEKL